MPDFRLGGREARERLAKQYPVGTRIELRYLCNDEPGMTKGLRGTVVGHDDQPSLLMAWGNGRSLSLFPGEDSFRQLTPFEIAEEQMPKADIFSGSDFQRDQTSGYPTVLVWNQTRGTAILQPAPAFDDDSDLANQCLRDCADWGVRTCNSWEDYNGLLKKLGPDAAENIVPIEDEDEDFGGMNLQ